MSSYDDPRKSDKWEKHLKDIDVTVSKKEEDNRTDKILLEKGRIPLGYFWLCPLCEIRFPAFSQPATLDGYVDKTRKRIVAHIETFHKTTLDEWEKQFPLREHIKKLHHT